VPQLPDIAGICIFITIMTALSIPIIAVIKHKPKNPRLEKKVEDLETRIAQLESENANKTIEIDSMKKEISYTVRLIGKD
jgi:hypothetical protein